MSFLEPFFPIPKTKRRSYLIGRVCLYATCILLAYLLALSFLFPVVPFSFNFRTPHSTKNTFLDPRSAPDQSSLTNGKIAGGQTLIGNFDRPGTFSRIRISFNLEKKSAAPTKIKASIARSYRAFFLPISSTPISSFEHPTLYRDTAGIYYSADQGMLKRFVSTAAYLSRYPKSFALPLDSSSASSLPIAPEWIGFRVGSLLSFADGIFLVVSEDEIRPFGDPDIFLSFGYRFEDVIPAHEEEIGIYKRGRILLYGNSQSDGTLFRDTDSGAYMIVNHNTLQPITSPEYRDFLLDRVSPINVSLAARNTDFSCVPQTSLIGKTYTCDIAPGALPTNFGSAFQLSLQNDSENTIDIRSFTVSLITDQTRENFLLSASQFKSRFLDRFGQGI